MTKYSSIITCFGSETRGWIMVVFSSNVHCVVRIMRKNAVSEELAVIKRRTKLNLRRSLFT